MEPTRLLVRDYLEKWLEVARTKVAPKTYERYEEIVRLHLAPALGHHQLAKLHSLHIESYYAEALVSGRRNGRGGFGPTRPDTYISTTPGDQKDGHRQVGIEDLVGGERPHIRLPTDPFEFGTMVREARKAKGWSQEQAADAVGISRPGLGNIETGRYPAGQSLRTKLAAVLELAP